MNDNNNVFDIVKFFDNICIYKRSRDLDQYIGESDKVFRYYFLEYPVHKAEYVTDRIPAFSNPIAILYSYKKLEESILNRPLHIDEYVEIMGDSLSFDDYITAIEEYESSELVE